MSESRLELRKRLGDIARNAVFLPGYGDVLNQPDWNEAAEAVYAEALRDIANLLDPGTGDTHVFPRLVIEQFAAERGIDLE